MTTKINNEQLSTNVYEKHGHTRVQWLVVSIVSMVMLNYGLETGWMSPMTKVLKSDLSPTGYPLSSNELSWVGSVTALMALCFVCLYAYLADAVGRKYSVLTVVVSQVLSWVIRLFATNTATLIVSRAMGGVASAGCFIALPMYVREISEDNTRGAMLSLIIAMQNFGLLFMYIMGSYMNYSSVLWISLSATVVTAVLMLFAPESPAFLVKKEKFDEALKTVALLRGLKEEDKIVQVEVEAMRNEENHYKTLPKITFLNIFHNKAWRRGFIFVMLVNTAQSGNGNFVIVTYVWIILSSTGVTLDPDLQSLVIPVLLICGSLSSIVLVQKLGRKLLLVSSMALVAVALASLATIQLLQSNGVNPPEWMPIFLISISVWAMSAASVPAFYAVVTEIFNFQVRSKLMGCVVSYAWFVSSIQTVVFLPITEMLGMHTMFFMFAGITAFGAVSALVCLPETKGRTVEEIERELAR